MVFQLQVWAWELTSSITTFAAFLTIFELEMEIL